MVVVAMDGGEARGYGHGWLGEMVGDLGDVLTMSWVTSMCSSSLRGSLVEEIGLGASSMA
jgi:hypothetical protein